MRYTFLVPLLVSLGLLGSACLHVNEASRVERRFENAFSCYDVDVRRTRSGYIAAGCGRQARYVCAQRPRPFAVFDVPATRCTRDVRPPLESGPGVRTAAGPGRVRAIRGDEGVELSSHVLLPNAHVALTSAPTRHPGLILVRISVRGLASSPTCNVDVVADGSPLPVTSSRVERVERHSVWSVLLDYDQADALTAADHIATRACGARVEWTERARDTLSSFLARAREEEAYASRER